MARSPDETQDANSGAPSPSATDETLLSESMDLAATSRGHRDEVEFKAGAIIGRYVVLARLGAGAMGVVFAAYDPELDRKVAIKVLRARSHKDKGEAARGRLQREAQALAKLNHPNVVGVHDVGLHDGSVFVAMEFVEGQTFGEWIREDKRGWEAIVDVLAAAGDGLSAAHEQGLVHRDFKPDNIMIGTDGRVRVMDFGLARSGESEGGQTLDIPGLEDSRPSSLDESLTRTGAVVGTPAYMAPEQFSGLVVTAHSDQFAFCVTLYEALFGVRPFSGGTFAALAYAVTKGEVSEPKGGAGIPGWLREATVRGLDRDPAKRHRDMATLLAVMRSGESRRRRKQLVALAGSAAALLVGAFGVQAWQTQHKLDACEASARSLDAIWNAQREATLRQGFAATGEDYAATVADKVVPWLERTREDWRSVRASTCRAHEVDQSLESPVYARANWCLEQAEIAFQSAVESMLEADRQTLQDAVLVAASLGPVSVCGDAEQLARMDEPPTAEARPKVRRLEAQLAEAGHLANKSQYEAAFTLTQSVRKEAEALDWRPLVARAATLEAELHYQKGEYEISEKVGVAAYLQAARWNVWDVAADAATSLAYNVGWELSRSDDGLLWAEHARVALAHAGDPLQLGEARRLSNTAAAMQTKGKVEEAIPLVEKALEINRRSLPEGHPTIAGELNDLAFLLSLANRHEEAKVLHQEALAAFETTYGPVHTDVAMSVNNLAFTVGELGDYDEALRLQRRALDIRKRVFGPDHPKVGEMYNNIATTLRTLDRLEESRDHYYEALRIKEAALGPNAVDLTIPLGNLASVLRKLEAYDEAEKLYQRALAIRVEAFGEAHQKVGNTLNNLAMLHYVQGHHAEAAELYERATTTWAAALGDTHPLVAHGKTGWGKSLLGLQRFDDALVLLEDALARREANERVPAKHLADTRFTVARALWEGGGDRGRARELARQAREGFSGAAAGDRHKLDEVEAWLAAHDAPTSP